MASDEVFVGKVDIEQPNGITTGIGWDRFLMPKNTTTESSKPKFHETLAANFRQYNIPYRVGKQLIETDYSLVGLNEPEEGFDPIQEGLLEGIPERYAMRVISARNKREAELRIANIKQELEDQETASRSGLVANMVTSFGATFLDPTTLIPAGQTIKYLDSTKAFIGNFKNAALQLGPVLAAQNAYLVSSKETKNVQDWFLDTATDTFFAASIGGLLGRFASKKIQGEIDGGKAYFKATGKDLDIVAEVNAKGEFEKFTIPEGSLQGVGAAEAKDIEAMLNAGTVSFKNNPYIKHIFGLGSPIVQGATSEFDIVKQLTTDIWGTNFRTSGGVARAIQDPGAYDFARSWSGLAAGLKAEKISAYLEWAGVSGPAPRIQAAIGAKTGKFKSETEFNKLVTMAVRRGYSDDAIVNGIAQKYTKIFNELWNETKVRFPDLTDHEFSNIKNHVMRLYDKDLIQRRPDDFARDVYKYLSDVNQRIASYQQPYITARERSRNLVAQYNALKGVKGSTKQRKLIKSQLEKVRAEIKQLNKQRLDDTRSGKLGLDMLEERVKVTPEQKRQIDKIGKSYKEALKKLKESKKQFEKAQGENKKILRKQTKELREVLAKEKAALKAKIISGEIAEELLYTDRFGRLWLKDPNRLPGLRPIQSAEQLKLNAENIRDTIQQLNEEQMTGAIFESVRGNTPGTLKGRKFLWNDAIAEPWLINDIDTISDVYLNSLGKYIHYEDVYKKYGGEEGVAKALKEQFEVKRSQLLEQPDSPERAKALNKLEKDLRKNEKLLENYKKAYFGSLVDYSSTPYKVSNALRQFTSSVLLTNMPLLMLTEFFTPTFKMTYKEFVHDGLVGSLAKINKFQDKIKASMGDRAAPYLKGYYSDALVGVNRLSGQSLEARFGYGKQYYQKSWYERYSDVSQKAIDVLSGASHIMDIQEVFQASATESRLMRILKRFTDGHKLEAWEIHALDEARINPNQWAKRMVGQFERKVNGQQIGEMLDDGYITNFHLWDDFEAAQRFRVALDRGVRAVITKPGPADVPFIFKDPMAGLFFQFLSWPFAATNNFLLPALTEFDRQKLTGILTILSAGSLIGPLRQLAKGQEVDLSFEALASSALANSGLFGWQYDMLARSLSYLNFKALRDDGTDTPTNKALRVLLPERHGGKGISALLGSPALGVLDMAGDTISAAVSGEFNQQAAVNTIRMVAPWLYTWETQRLIKKVLRNTDLPENRREARG